MKILLVSDSHMYNETLIHIINQMTYDIIIHCGDSSLSKKDKLLKEFTTVRGNHDEDFLPIIETVNIEEYRCLVTHGHYFHVYAGYEELYNYMVKENYDICFHGHTHVPNYTVYNDKVFINPGSTMFNRGEYGCGSFALVELIDKKIKVQFYNSETLQPINKNILESGKKILDEFKKIAIKK